MKNFELHIEVSLGDMFRCPRRVGRLLVALFDRALSVLVNALPPPQTAAREVATAQG